MLKKENERKTASCLFFKMGHLVNGPFNFFPGEKKNIPNHCKHVIFSDRY